MQNKRLVAIAAVGLAAAIAVPTIAFGNARNATPNPATTPLVGLMNGPADLTATTPTGDADGTGTAAFTFTIANPLDAIAGATVCWDLSYSNLTGTPIAAHIHQGVAGVAGGIVIPNGGVSFPALGPNGASGCQTTAGTIATQVVNNPAGFYVNVHTTDFPLGAIRSQLSNAPAPAGEAHLLPSPLRAYDSRTVDGPLAINATRTISLASGLDGAKAIQIAVPAGATSAIVTLTATNTTAGVGGPGGFLTMYSAALATPPSTSSINWTGAGQNVAVTTQVAVDANGRVKVTDGANAADFVLDVIGYTF